MKVSRRELLRGLGWTAAGVTAVVTLPGCSTLLPPLPTFASPDEASGLAWIQLDAGGRLRLISPRQEIGQGISVSLRTIAAEELGVDPSRIEVTLHRTDEIAPVGSTVGSQSILDYAEPVAIASACLREALIDRAAERLEVGRDVLRLEDAGAKGPNEVLSWTSLALGAPLVLDADRIADVRLQSLGPGKKRSVGHPRPTDGIREIVTGGRLYAGDVQREGMLQGGIARPPSLDSELVTFDAEAARRVPGVVAVVELEDAPGVVAETQLDLERGLLALACQWKPREEITQQAIDEAMDIDADRGGLEHDIRDDRVQQDGEWTVDLRVDVPMAAHFCMEPKCAVADVRDDHADVFVGTQDAFYVRDAVRRAVGLPEDRVVVHSQRLGGGFGSGSLWWPAVEAALLSQAVSRPVKVTWSRSECFQRGYHRPPSSHRLRVRVDDQGQMTDWHHRFKSGHVIFTSAALPGWLQRATSLIGDFGVARGANPPYTVTRTRVEFSDVRIPVDTGPWRGLGAGPNHFAVESAIDQAARATGRDPIAFRLAHLDDPRLRRVLEHAAALADWRDGDALAGRGVACGFYKEMSYAAIIADVDLDPRARTASVRRLYCAHDCGRVINPDQVRAQIEGNLVWGLGLVMSERLGVASGRIDADGPTQYRIPTFRDVPEIEIELVGVDQGPPTGAGETAIVGAAAVTNALAGLIGRPLTQLPIRPERLGDPSP